MFFMFLCMIVFIAISISCIKIINQSTVGIVMRLGKFHKKAETGVNFILPFVDRVVKTIDLREQVLDFPPQPVITKDNVTMQIDTIIYYNVSDPISYTFEIANPINAIENLTATTLRNIVGELDLDETLTSRDTVNVKLRSLLDEATDRWGIKVNRVELKNIKPPKDIQEAMEKQMRAERERRESVLRAEGQKAAAILEAEGQKESSILKAEAKKETLKREAEGAKEAAILEAQGKALAILEVKKAEAEGIKVVYSAIKDSDIDDRILTLKNIEALEKLGESPSSKLIIPMETVGSLGSIAALGDVLNFSKENK